MSDIHKFAEALTKLSRRYGIWLSVDGESLVGKEIEAGVRPVYGQITLGDAEDGEYWVEGNEVQDAR